MKKKTIALLLVLMLVFGVTCGGTIAYLTSTTDTITNTFTVGKVTITLDEIEVDEYGVAAEGAVRIPNKDSKKTGNEYKLIPGHTYTKDPTIHVDADSEKCWLFVKVVDGIAEIQDATTVAAQMATNGWSEVSGETNVYVYNKIAEPGENAPIFANFKIKNDADVSSYADKTITITAYAVQADGVADAATAWAAVPDENKK